MSSILYLIADNGNQGCEAHSHLSLCSFTHNIWGRSLYALFLIRSGQMIKIGTAVWKNMWECKLHIHGAHQLWFRSTLLFCCPSPCSWLDVSMGSGAIGAILDSQRTCKWKLHTNKTGVETARAWAHKNAVSTMPTLAWMCLDSVAWEISKFQYCIGHCYFQFL